MTPQYAPVAEAPAVLSGAARTSVQNKPHAGDPPIMIDASILDASDTFVHRHIGPDSHEISEMLRTIGCSSLEQLIEQTVPASIRLQRQLNLGPQRSEHEVLTELRSLAQKNQVFRSYIGTGYYGTIVPPVILRNILENPGWYTQYTPYQAEISQGRLEALINFQTMVADLTGLPLANASLLDEATAAAEAMTMCLRIVDGRNKFFVSRLCHPQTIAVVKTRAEAIGMECVVGDRDDDSTAFTNARKQSASAFAGILLQYPATNGSIRDHRSLIQTAHDCGTLVVMATDLLALTLLTPPGELGADIAVGSAQRFGVPMGFGGPHAAFMSTHEEHARKMPGRIIGVSKDALGNIAYRMAIQTREQHIKRERATSNICTAQVLLAIMAGMYAVYHGPEGLRRIARRVHAGAVALAAGLRKLGHAIEHNHYFDTIQVRPAGLSTDAVRHAAAAKRINLRDHGDGSFGISIDETTDRRDVLDLWEIFTPKSASRLANTPDTMIDASALTPASLCARTSPYLAHPVFNTHHSETEMLRYIAKLQSRDLSLATSMIPLGSCTMKLNGTSEMIPVTWPEFANMHPFAPPEQTRGYAELFNRLESQLAEITGFNAISLQPNAGSQGEYAGLLVIRAYHHARNEPNRNICLIPVSAHGTNPASAVMAGFEVLPVACDANGNIDLNDLRTKAQQHRSNLGAIMVTYPSTHGVFESSIRELCDIVHEHGGQVYLDGANMNAQVGLCRPGDYGADVCHLNLHKTFCIPHGGGGPGMGPIGVAKHLAPFLPTHPLSFVSAANSPVSGHPPLGPVSAAPYGSAAILPISYIYITLMGATGLKHATEIAILNANYMASRLKHHFNILFAGEQGRCAHEFIIDFRPFKKSAGIETEDVAKRLMDYGFHAPTMSFPVPGTLMIEPTESETRAELDRFCDALIAIREEIRQIESGRWTREDNPLVNAPHTARMIAAGHWSHLYTREQAAFPAAHTLEHKFWPYVARIDNPWGDRNLHCTCPPLESHIN